MRSSTCAVLVLFALSGCGRKAGAPAGATAVLSGAPAAASGQAPEAPPSARVPAPEQGEPVLVAGQTTGYARLADGLVIRAVKQACPSARPRHEECRSSKRRCKTDAECTAKPNGHCTDLGDSLGCGCQYGCLDDRDCAQNQICLCGEPVGSCVEVTCTSDTCAAPQRCATYHDGCSYKPFSCLEHAGARTCTF